MKYLLILSMVIFTGCFSLSVKGEYSNYQHEFYKMLSRPFTETDRQKMETRFKELKVRVENENYSKKVKEKFYRDIDYYLMVLEDLKD